MHEPHFCDIFEHGLLDGFVAPFDPSPGAAAACTATGLQATQVCARVLSSRLLIDVGHCKSTKNVDISKFMTGSTYF